MKNISVIFFGTPEFVVPILETLHQNFEVKAVVTTPNSPVSEYAKKNNIPALTPEKLDQDFLTTHYSLLTTDLFVVSAYGKIIPQKILDIPKYGSLNVHPSLLPKYRGASPVQAALLSGEKETGLTIIKMDQEMDHGLIIYQEKVKIPTADNALTLMENLFKKGSEVLINLIPDFIAGKVKETVQNHEEATFCKIIKKEDGYFEIENPPTNLAQMVKAYYPWPGVWTKWNNKVVKFLPEGLVQMEGKKPTSLKDFLNGYPNFPLRDIKQAE